MNTYKWTISQLDCKPKEAENSNVVVTAHWNLDATDGTLSSGAYGTQSFTLEQGIAFTPFESLTEDQVIGWIKEFMGADAVTALQENLDKQITNLINPSIINPQLPWAA